MSRARSRDGAVMDDFSPGGGSRFLDIAVAILLAAMALYGAVLILQAIWVWLCIGLAVAGLVAGAVLFFLHAFRRW